MPGPDILFVLNQSLESKKTGLLISIGLCSGLIVHTLILVFGLSAFIENNEYVISYLKYFGTLYLFYLAFVELIAKFKQASKPNNTNLFLRGLYMNLVNPKVLLFFIAYFPNFLFSETLSISLQFLILGSIFIFQALIVFSSVSLASNKLVSYLKVDTADYRLTYFKAFVFAIIGLSILLL
jgi:threonine/homoserine/homoserine lactone efflux protein